MLSSVWQGPLFVSIRRITLTLGCIRQNAWCPHHPAKIAPHIQSVKRGLDPAPYPLVRAAGQSFANLHIEKIGCLVV